MAYEILDNQLLTRNDDSDLNKVLAYLLYELPPSVRTMNLARELAEISTCYLEPLGKIVASLRLSPLRLSHE